MTPGRGRLTLAERSALTEASEGRVAGGRHCWVHDPPGNHGRWPGLLIGWARDSAGRWIGRTVYAVTLVDSPTVLIEAWLDACHLHER